MEEEEKDKRTLHFQASGGLRYLAGLREVFPSLPIRKGIFIIIKMMIFFKRGKQDRLAPPSGIGNSQGKEGRYVPLDPRGSKSLNIIGWNNKRLERLDTLADGCLQQKAHLGHWHPALERPLRLIFGLSQSQSPLSTPSSAGRPFPSPFHTKGIVSGLLKNFFPPVSFI